MCCLFRNCHQDTYYRTPKIAAFTLNFWPRCPTSNVSHLRVCDLTGPVAVHGSLKTYVFKERKTKSMDNKHIQKHTKTYKHYRISETKAERLDWVNWNVRKSLKSENNMHCFDLDQVTNFRCFTTAASWPCSLANASSSCDGMWIIWTLNGIWRQF